MMTSDAALDVQYFVHQTHRQSTAKVEAAQRIGVFGREITE
ncbi:hypothetical protein [Candidatus Accumulibacter vicinus]|nr:hypothetical protein [Candidatus Accumulibacter vicinus]